MSTNSNLYYTNLIKIVAQRCILFASYLLWTILFARYYGPVESKNFNLQISSYGLLLILCGLSMETGFVYVTQKLNIRHNVIINSALVTALIAGVIAALVAVIFKNSMYNFFNVALKPWHAFAYVFAWLFTGTCQYIYQIKQKILLFNIIVAVITLLLIGCLYYYPKMKEVGYYGNYHFSFLIGQAVVLFLVFLIFNKSKATETFLNAIDFKKVLKFSITVFATNLVTFFMFKIDYFILEHYLNYHTNNVIPSYQQNQQNGNYNIASRLVQTILTVTVIIAQTMFPEFALEKNRLLSYKRTNEIAKYVFIGFFISCVLIALCSKYIFTAIFGAGFNTMYKDFFYLIPGLIAQGVSGCFSAFLMGINNVKVVLHGCIIALVVILIGDVIFIPKFGTLAAALVSSVGYTVQCFYSIYIINKQKLYQ